jgi:hypothetical protein
MKRSDRDVMAYDLFVVLSSGIVGACALVAACMGAWWHIVSVAVCGLLAWVHWREFKSMDKKS